MKHIARYFFGPRYDTEHVTNQTRQVYQAGDATIYLGRQHEPVKRYEVFAFVEGGPLWFLGRFVGKMAWRDAEKRVERMIEEWRAKA